MNRTLKKLRSRSGESIGETLVALLISALALVMLAAAITSATGIINRSNTAIEQRYADTTSMPRYWRPLAEENIK